MRDALSLFDRVSLFSDNNITLKSANENLNILDYDYYFKITEFLLAENIKDSIITFNEIIDLGFDGRIFISGLASHFRNLILARFRDEEVIKLINVSESTRKEYISQAEKVDDKYLISALKICEKTELDYRASHNQMLLIEIALMKISNINYESKKKNEVANTEVESKVVKKLPKEDHESVKNLAKDVSKEFSLSNLNNTRREEDIKSYSEETKEFNIDIVKEYIEEQKKANKSLYTILLNSDIKIEKNEIKIKVNNNLSQKSIGEDKANFIDFIRNKTGKTILIETYVEEKKNVEKKRIIYTDKDKWNYLKSKNINITKLITEYNFDF